MGIWKVLGALVITSILSIGAAYVFTKLGWIGSLQPKAWLVLGVVTLGLLFKLLFGDLASGEFHYNKHGYDLCVLTMGASLSGLSLQLLSQDNLFPGLAAAGPLVIATMLTSDPIGQIRFLMFGFFLVSCFSALLTARISRAIRSGDSKANGALACINFCIGASMLGWYVLILITKE